MSRKVSLLVLVGTVLVVGALFFHVVRPFLFPLFFAGVLALLFRPFYRWLTRLCRGHQRIAALLATGCIVGLVILPVVGASWLAVDQLIRFGGNLVETDARLSRQIETEQLSARLHDKLSAQERATLRRGILRGERPTKALPRPQSMETATLLEQLESRYSLDDLQERFRRNFPSAVETQAEWPLLQRLLRRVVPASLREPLQDLGRTSVSLAQGVIASIYERTRALITDAIRFVIGVAVMIVAMYYFLADGPRLMRIAHNLLPLDAKDSTSLFREFDQVCRGVVLGTVVAALAQAALTGIGLAIAGVGHVWLLSGLTMFTSLIPFLGAASVYGAVSIVLLVQGQYAAALFLLAYGAAVVSSADNLIRAYVIRGRSHLHPLVALVTVLGALRVIGVWGIFIGPIVAAFFYAILNILHDKLEADTEGIA